MNTKSSFRASTSIIIIGASKYTEWSALDSNSEQFINSYNAIKLLFHEHFNIGNTYKLLDLFNSEDTVEEQINKISYFIENDKNGKKNLLIYFLGHAGNIADKFYLSLRKSKENNPISNLNPDNIADTIQERGRQLNVFLIIDSCFAGKVKDSFLELKVQGVTLLCSSASDKTSKVLIKYTAFAKAFIKVLTYGDIENQNKYLTLRDIFNKIPNDNHLAPTIHTPIQTKGKDIADNPLFINKRLLDNKLKFTEYKNDSNIIECVVIESSIEETTQNNESLGNIVSDSLEKNKDKIEAIATKKLRIQPITNNINKIIENDANFHNTINALCRSELVIFDMTNNEPAIMLLLGIRAVVRRGITIVSMGANLTMESLIDQPFNIREVNLIFHSKKQVDLENPIDIISKKIISGFEQLEHSSSYLDLPVFDAIRTLPPKASDRNIKSIKEQVLILCPFSKEYTQNNWKRYLLPKIQVPLSKLSNGDTGQIIRTLDMKSPRLASQSLYEAIRLTSMCIIDWSEWRSNVFFELGVRLSSNIINPVCIIDKSSNIQEHTHTKYQIEKLFEMFDPIIYDAPSKGRASTARDRSYKDMIERYNTKPSNIIYEVVSKNFDIKADTNSLPIYRELIKDADLLLPEEQDSIGVSSILYPSNEDLEQSSKRNAIHKRLAAWYFMTNYYKSELETSLELREEYVKLGDSISSTLIDSDDEKDQLIAEEIESIIEKYNKLGDLNEKLY